MKKIYCEATIEDDFADDCVLVVLDRNISAINKIHERSFFGSSIIENVVDLTAVSHDSSVSSTDNSLISQIDQENFRQILKLELPVAGKEYVLKVIKLLEQIDGIMYAGPNYISSLCATVPDDTSYRLQDELDNIEATEAWDITTGSADVLVGVIDSGIASHPDLDENVTSGWDFYNENAVTTDDINGHGTHVAGIIGAVGNNGEGVTGVAWDVTLVPLQVTSDSSSVKTEDIIEAIIYATNNNISILNCSMGWYNYDVAQRLAIANYPGLFVCAAGNDTTNNDSIPFYPASYDCKNIISVANSRASDTLFGESNYGAETVHLAAPGTFIYSTYLSNGYISMTGTSMAAPHVTGVAALIKSIRPDLSATEIKELILNNVDAVDALAGKCVTGGRLNAYKAVRAATEPQTFTGDVNNDGRSDMILSRNIDGKRAFTVYLGKAEGTFEEPITTQSTRKFFYSDPAFVGDFNGDGKTDILIHWRNNDTHKRQLLVYISKGDGTFYEGVDLSSSRYHNMSLYPCEFFVADVNGDDKDDFVVHYRNDDGKRCALVYKGTASSPYLTDATTNALTSTDDYIFSESVYMGDFNGDGCSDMLVHGANSDDKRQLLIYKGCADGTFATGVTLSSSRYHIPALYPTKTFVTDVNGDGKDDFVVHWKNTSNNRCTLVYNGTDSDIPLLDAISNPLISTDEYIESDPVFVGDINGDGLSDMIVQWANENKKRQLLIYIANADGTYNEGVNRATDNSQDPTVYAGAFFVADVNGDGRDDFIVKWRNGSKTEFLTYRGTADGTFLGALRTMPETIIPYYNES